LGFVMRKCRVIGSRLDKRLAGYVGRSMSILGCGYSRSCLYHSSRIEAGIDGMNDWQIGLQEVIDENVAKSLYRNGYAVVANAVSSDFCKLLRTEIEVLHSNEALYPNKTHFVNTSTGTTSYLQKKSIFETDGHNPELLESSKNDIPLLLISKFERDPSLSTLLSLYEPKFSLKRQTIKAQLTKSNGGCFPIHTDSDELVDERKVTAILYLNQEWMPKDGGQLVLYPFPNDTVTIEPREGTLALFSSCHMLHRTLPYTASEKTRYCITQWLSGDVKSNAVEFDALSSNAEDSWRRLFTKSLRGHLTKLMLCEEWIESIIASHNESEDRKFVVNTLNSEVEQIFHKIKVSFPEFTHDCHSALELRQKITTQIPQIRQSQTTLWF